MSFKKFAAAENAVRDTSPDKASKAIPMMGPQKKPAEPADKPDVEKASLDKS